METIHNFSMTLALKEALKNISMLQHYLSKETLCIKESILPHCPYHGKRQILDFVTRYWVSYQSKTKILSDCFLNQILIL